MSSSIGKRQRERQKLERAQVKAERRADRQAAGAGGEDTGAAVPSDRSELELIEDLRALQRAFGDGDMSAEDFAERRDHIQAQLERLSS